MKSSLYIYVFVILTVFISCDIIPEKDNTDSNINTLDSLPVDTGGSHTAHILGSTNAPYGFYMYTPDGSQKKSHDYPLLIFLHGSGEKGDSSNDPAKLDLVLKNGPPKMIEKKEWSPRYPMLVASPQSISWWNSNDLHDFITYLIDTYNVDKSRIYLTGLSMGGYGTYNYLTNITEGNYIAAAVPICGQGNINKADNINIPLWAFHGDADTTVKPTPDIAMVEAINLTDISVKAKITIYPEVGHNSWSRTYDCTGMGKEDINYAPFDIDIYTWMLNYQK